MESSGAARLLTNLFFRGTDKKNKQELENAIGNLGGQIYATFERDVIGLTMNVDKNDVQEATKLLCEMVLERKIDDKQIEQEKRVL